MRWRLIFLQHVLVQGWNGGSSRSGPHLLLPFLCSAYRTLAPHSSLGEGGAGPAEGAPFPFKAQFKCAHICSAYVLLIRPFYLQGSLGDASILGDQMPSWNLGIWLLKEEGEMDLGGQLLLSASPPQLRVLERIQAVSVTWRSTREAYVPRAHASVLLWEWIKVHPELQSAMSL